MTTEQLPVITVNGVQYYIDYGAGWALERQPDWDIFDSSQYQWKKTRCPVYVWRCVEDPEYTAPDHVSRACSAAYQLACEIEDAERAAGWDPNP